MKEDLAILVDRTVSYGTIRTSLLNHPYVQTADLFDLYEGPAIPAGKKSLAIAVEYNARDRVLTKPEITAIRAEILGALREAFGARLR